MAKKSNIIELNGRRYDALTGRLLGDEVADSQPSAIPHNNGRSMDGFVTGSPKIPPAAQVAAPTAPTSHTAVAKAISDVMRRPAKRAVHHKPTASQTLMRHAVHKPATSPLRHTKVQQRTDVLVKQPSITVVPKLSSYHLDPKRLQHAKQTPRHQDIHRYAQPRPTLAATLGVPTATNKPTVAAVQPVHAAAASTAVRSPAAPKAHSMDIFERALAEANSHAQKPISKRRTKQHRAIFGSRALSIGAASLAVLLLVGFFAWQQKAVLTMHYAASKSGVAATLPGYKPAGFTAGKFTYSPGLVAVNFDNSKTGDNFALIEKSTSWDSDALRDSFVASRSQTFQTIDAAGRTIYTYGNNNATWVNGGVWYQVNSQGSLTNNQLVDLAASM